MNEYLYEDYKRCQIYACAQVDPVADEGSGAGAVYQRVTVIKWQDDTGAHRKLLCGPKRRFFPRSGDALRIATAMAKRHVDITSLPLDWTDARGPHQIRWLLSDDTVGNCE
jgi:hypothetical protein